jgi:hypothetical protein
MFGSFVNPIGLENADWKYVLVYVCWLVFEVCTRSTHHSIGMS